MNALNQRQGIAATSDFFNAIGRFQSLSWPNFDAGEHPAEGRVCVKAYGLIEKTYNPNRIARPMKRRALS